MKLYKIFWKHYRIELTTPDRKFLNVFFLSGFTGDVIKAALQEAADKTVREKTPWAVDKIERVK